MKISGRAIAPWSLVLVAVLWGSTFFSTKRLVTHLAVPDFLAVRFLISTVVLVAALVIRGGKLTRTTMKRGAVLGTLWAVAQLTQTIGLEHTSASISGFVTGLYVVLTPVFGLLIFKIRVHQRVWIAVGLATAGLGVLTLRPETGGLGLGEGLTIISAALFAIHIIILGRWSTPSQALPLTVAQSIVMTVILFIIAAPDGIQLPDTGEAWIWVVYLAVFCGALTLLLQTWAQSHLEASKAAVIMCSEPLWATFFAIGFGGERPTWLFAIGAASILAAMYLVVRSPAATPAPGD
ncbi:MAG: DMT family transporter [Propionibacteriaceae bacterium]|jgi:drug/metabolite transporter (DMT)-like permease|nr:DMT family transporter [Propionibacteriaceae bacterium]